MFFTREFIVPTKVKIESTKMKTCLIGASGFVGTRLIEKRKENGDFLINIDIKQSTFYPEHTVKGDVRDTQTLIEKLIGVNAVVLLAAEHRDDVSPTSLYYDVNVQGTKNVLDAMDANGIKRIIFTSSVAVYGLNKKNPNEEHTQDPFNHYGKSKWQAEEVLREWYNKDKENRCLTIIRPTVIFGERNRGNVYNLLKQISSGKFLMVGSGNNKKSMAYVGNVVAFIDFCIQNRQFGYEVYNYIDKPDFTMNELVSLVGKVLRKHIPSLHVPYFVGLIAGYGFDFVAKLLKKKLSVSSVRVKKFCATTQFDSEKAHSSGFKAPYTLEEGLERTLTYEFIRPAHEKDDILFISE